MDAKRGLEEKNVSRQDAWKVGELTRRTGLSARALHHYEEVGLLVPSGRTEGHGDRLYSEADVLRLQQVVSLRSLGFSLGERAGKAAREALDRELVEEMTAGAPEILSSTSEMWHGEETVGGMDAALMRRRADGFASLSGEPRTVRARSPSHPTCACR